MKAISFLTYLLSDLLSDLLSVSIWIANLGVEPWLSLNAFLLLPIFVFFALLLFLVTRVLETITQLLYNLNNSLFLPVLATHVKTICATIGLFLTFLQSGPIHATKNQALKKNSQSLSRGQITKIAIKGIRRFSVANREVIQAKVIDSNSTLLVKAKSLGTSDLIIWTKFTKEPLHYHFNVISKKKIRNLKYYSHLFKNLQINHKIINDRLSIEAQINNIKQYKSLAVARVSLKKALNLKDLKLTDKLSSQVYAQFLRRLFQLNLYNLNCELKEAYLECLELPKQYRASLKVLENEFLFSWLPTDGINAAKTFEVSLTLHQIENSAGKSFSLGLDRLKGNWNEVITSSPFSLIYQNEIQANKSDYKSKTLANPKILARYQRPVRVRIGQEVPFIQNVTNGVATQQWKFAGLAIDVNVKPFGDQLLVDYETNLSNPSEGKISKNYQKSSVQIAFNTQRLLFDIGFRTNNKLKSQMPFLSTIPIFGSLFRGTNSNTTYKKIICVIKIKEI